MQTASSPHIRGRIPAAALMACLCLLPPAAAVLAQTDANHVHDHAAPVQTGGMDDTDHAAMDHAMHAGMSDAATAFPRDTRGLPEAEPTAVVALEDGDTYDITASYVKRTSGDRTLRMLAYNGSVPGPLIKVPRGGEVRINFTNDTDIEQTIHSHGVRVDNRSDGVPGLTQDSVPPGGSYTYTLKFRDAGVFWYHPHTRADYGQELGLYGNYLVEPTAPGYWNPVNREIPLVIDDILIEDGHIAEFYREFTNFALLGRFGNKFLVNGREDFELTASRGEVIRFFITNTSNARSYNLSIPGVLLKLVGADLGKFEHESFTDHFLISPGERVVVEAYFKNPGRFYLTHTQMDGQVHLAGLEVSDSDRVETSHADAFSVLRHNDDVHAEVSRLRRYLEAEPDKELLLSIELAGQDVDHSMHAHVHTEEDLHHHSEHVAQGMPAFGSYQPMTPTAETLEKLQWSDPGQSDRSHRTPEIFWKVIDTATGKVSMDIDDWTFKAGELVKVRIVNDPDADHLMQHPMHFHGQQFVVLAVDGLPNNNLAWKDTVLLFPGQTADILVDMSNTGEWMAHCHISEHLHAGMMFTFRVEDEHGHAAGDDYRATAAPHLH